MKLGAAKFSRTLSFVFVLFFFFSFVPSRAFAEGPESGRRYSASDFLVATSPETKLLSSGCRKTGAQTVYEGCGITPCEEAKVLQGGSALNGGLPVIRCYIERYPDGVCFQDERSPEPMESDDREALLTEMLKGGRDEASRRQPKKETCKRRGRRIQIGRFPRGPDLEIFYAQKGDRFVPAYTYEELAEIIGGINTAEEAIAFADAVLGFEIHKTETKVTNDRNGFAFTDIFLGGTGRCNYLSKMNIHLSKDGSNSIDEETRNLVEKPASGCRTD